MFIESHKKNEKNALTAALTQKKIFLSHFCQFRSTLDGCLRCYNKKKKNFN